MPLGRIRDLRPYWVGACIARGHKIMASDDDTDSAVSLVLADLRSMGCELRPDSVKRLRRVLAEDPERRERARQSMANGGRKGFRARRSAQQGLIPTAFRSDSLAIS